MFKGVYIQANIYLGVTNQHKDIIYSYIIKSFDIMDFSAETPEEKKIRLGGVVKVIERVLPAIAPFVPALQPVAAVVGAIRSK